MKVLIIALVCVVAVVSEQKRCKKTEDCEANECCLISNYFRWGKCKPLAKEKQRCRSPDDILDGVYLRRCPCESGFKCEPEKVRESKFPGDLLIKINERCVKENEVTIEDGGEVTTEGSAE